jgi:D-lactate dehydrogenase
VLDSADAASRAAFAARRPDLLEQLAALGREVRADVTLTARIRHKFRLKNTVGYSLNALVDFDDPIDILTHLMIGSEGTLGFISEITYRTVPDHAHKASALILFDDLETACRAVTLLKGEPVDAVELADRLALRSVQGQPGLPASLAEIGPDGAALLVETRAPDAAALRAQIDRVEAALGGLATHRPARFSTDAAECARYWAVRKGMFPSVGAVRDAGTTVVIEDVAFPVERLAQATLDLQALLRAHGYAEAIIFGHALEGNLHFVFTQGFDDPAEVARYARFMDDVAALVVDKYDGSLKAEHGTGRNMAPFVEKEWGAQALALMHRIKALFDPQGLLNPGVILNADPRAHLQHLKPLPAADAIVDKCIECGFCEPKCPSRGLTLSPRQRIVGWREIARAERESGAPAGELRGLYAHAGIDTCAACGLCATACPVGIETGLLIKALRGRAASPLARRIGLAAASHFGAVTAGVRLGLGAADRLHGALGTRTMQGSLDRLRSLSGGRLPKWSPALARPARFVPPQQASLGTGAPLVYFPSCAARNMGPQRGDDEARPVPEAAERLFRKAGFDVIVPAGLAPLCCGQPFESKGLDAAAHAKSAELEATLREASRGGELPIVFDTSPCAYRMKRFLAGRLDVRDAVEFVHDVVLPRVTLEPRAATVAVHPVCSLRKMGHADKLAAIAARCSARVVTVDEVQCCGFAGDRGFTHPELNEHALRHLRNSLPPDCQAGYSSSRTCEIGLSEAAGIPYRSILDLVEACAR